MIKTVVLWTAAALALAILVVIVVAATRPDTFSVQRRTTIQAPPDIILPLIVDFRQWPRWSPWEKLDPDMKRTLSGAASGPGAVYEWQGAGKVGAGRMEIREVTPPAKVEIQLDFIKPFKGHNIVEFTLVPRDGSTGVTWLMHGPAPFVSKVMGVFFDMDMMIGKDFEAGLANLKAAAEKGNS